MAKEVLTRQEIADIKAILQDPEINQMRVAEAYKVSPAVINRIARGVSHVTVKPSKRSLYIPGTLYQNKSRGRYQRPEDRRFG